MSKNDNYAVDLVKGLQEIVGQITARENPKDDTQVVWEGTQVKLPADPERMTYRKGVEVLLAREAAENQEYDLFERVPGMPLDAAAAFAHVLKERYGWLAAQTKQTIFGPQPPQMKVVKTGPKPEDYIEVPIGEFKLHDISTTIETGFARPSKDRKAQFMDFYIQATVNYADRQVIMDLIAATRRHMTENSIYRGKAMRLSVDGGGDLDSLIEPNFIDLAAVDTKALVLNDDVQDLVNVSLRTPIQKTDACRRHNIPLKRGILLYGPYGTGKTLTALVTAREAVENGWTYVMVDDSSALAATLEFARQFQPCVVFAEDIDRVVDHKRTDDANDIINTIDGALSKSDEVITVLTTNHIDRIPPVMLRNGRLDALVPINLPDQKAAMRLVRYYSGPLLDDATDLSGLGEMLEGFIPATIREVVERAKLSMLMHDRQQLSQGDLKTSAFGLKEHANLLSDKTPEPTAEEAFGKAFKGLLNGHDSLSEEDLEEIEVSVEQTKAAIGNYGSAILDNTNKIKKLISQATDQMMQDPRFREIVDRLNRIEGHVS